MKKHYGLNNYDSIVETLELLTKDTAAGSKATSHLNSVVNFKFLITLVTVEYYLKFTKPLSISFQSADCDLVPATESFKEQVDLLQRKRLNDNQFSEIFNKATDISARFDIDVKMQRIVVHVKTTTSF